MPSGVVTTEHHTEKRAPVLAIWNVPNLLLEFQRVVTEFLTSRELMMREYATIPRPSKINCVPSLNRPSSVAS